MKIFKFDRGWNILIYFDFVLPAVIYLLAWITQNIFLSRLFHSYLIYLINLVPDFESLTGIIGIVFHISIIIYTIIKKRTYDTAVCAVISIIVAVFFWMEYNYAILKPLNI
jgi:hypothetical protein